MNSQKLRDDDIALLTRKYVDLELNHLALLNKTSLYCFVFRDDPKQCEFYNINQEDIQAIRKKQVDDQDLMSSLEEKNPAIA